MNLFKKKPEPQNPQPELRDTLFGDLPFNEWPADESSASDEPWATFLRARRLLGVGDMDGGMKQLQTVLAMRGLESRHYVQVWHFLRRLGVQPAADIAKHVYGVIVEVNIEGMGLDIVAAYEDYHARFLHNSGSAIIWEDPDDSLHPHIDALLQSARQVMQYIGPYDQEGHLPPPPPEQVRLNILAPGGLHFGQGPFQVLAQDAMGGPIIGAATQLMQALIEKSPQ